MAKVNLSAEQANGLIVQMKGAHAGKGRFLDIKMPNGKRLGDCSSEYAGEVGEALCRHGLLIGELLG